MRRIASALLLTILFSGPAMAGSDDCFLRGLNGVERRVDQASQAGNAGVHRELGALSVEDEVVFRTVDGREVSGQIFGDPRTGAVVGADGNVRVNIGHGRGPSDLLMVEPVRVSDLDPNGIRITSTKINGQRVATAAGDAANPAQYISYVSGSQRRPARVVGMRRNPATGQLEVTVHRIGPGGIEEVTLTAEELASARLSGTSQREFARVQAPARPAAPVVQAPPTRAQLPNGQSVAVGGSEGFVSVQLGGQGRMPARVKGIRQAPGGELTLEVEILDPRTGAIETRVLTSSEFASARRSDTAAQAFTGRAANPGPARVPEPVRAPAQAARPPLGPVPMEPPPTPPTAAQRAERVAEAFPQDQKHIVSTHASVNQRNHPRHKIRLPFDNRMADRAFSTKKGLIFENVPLAELPRENFYTYVILRDGSVSYGKVENSWEFGVKHMHLANGREVMVAGEIFVDAAGSVKFNIESGTFTRYIEQAGVPAETLQSQARYVFGHEVGSAGVEIVGKKDLFQRSLSNPTADQLRELCASAEFVASPNNRGFCQ